MSLEDQTLEISKAKIEELVAEKSETTFVSEEGKLTIQKEDSKPLSLREQMDTLKHEIEEITESRKKILAAEQAYGMAKEAHTVGLSENAKLPLEEKIQKLQKLKEIYKKQNRGILRKFFSLFSF